MAYSATVAYNSLDPANTELHRLCLRMLNYKEMFISLKIVAERFEPAATGCFCLLTNRIFTRGTVYANQSKIKLSDWALIEQPVSRNVIWLPLVWRRLIVGLIVEATNDCIRLLT